MVERGLLARKSYTDKSGVQYVSFVYVPWNLSNNLGRVLNIFLKSSFCN